ncbi:hypothetical protein [Nocardia sp. NPDC004260]
MPRWIPILGTRLPEIVPDDTDVLFNPAGDHPFGLTTTAICSAGQA